MPEWQLSRQEWKQLGWLLENTATKPGGPGRPRLEDTKRLAEACLFHHCRSLAPKFSAFGWHQLPEKLGVSGSTANRRYRAWLVSGQWLSFWDALMRHRQRGKKRYSRPDSQAPDSALASPVQPLIATLEQAYLFFNDRFFGGGLPGNVVITLEDFQPRRRKSPAGYFCGRKWGSPTAERGARHHIMISTLAVAGGKEGTLEVLLHEMTHCRNYDLGLADCTGRNQYHNRHFRDTALLAGLRCDFARPGGYAQTSLTERGREAVAAFPLDNETLFTDLRRLTLLQGRAS